MIKNDNNLFYVNLNSKTEIKSIKIQIIEIKSINFQKLSWLT